MNITNPIISHYYDHNISSIILFIMALIPIIAYPLKSVLISNEKKIWRIWGETFSSIQTIIAIIGYIVLANISTTISQYKSIYWTCFAIIIVAYLLYTGYKIKKAFILRKKYQNDAFRHSIQVFNLLCIGTLIIIITYFFKLTENSNFTPYAIFASLLTWIFREPILGIFSYFHLRSNNLLHIGDWIEIPELNIDGVITNISLITVTVRNWDTTTSNVAINKLQTNSFKNNQEMLNGNTDGRRMYRSLTIDSSSISILDKSQLNELDEKLTNLGFNTIFLKELRNNSPELLNLQIYRHFLRSWLANHQEISHTPRLIVRTLEPKAEGTPLQIYVYIRKFNLYQFELAQSEITEFAILSMAWFGLRLYQKPTSNDISEITKYFNNQKSINDGIS